MTENNSLEEASWGTESPERDWSVLAGIKEEQSTTHKLQLHTLSLKTPKFTTENNSLEEASCGTESPESDWSVLAGIKEEISNINTAVRGEPTNSTKASFFLNCDAVEEVCVGHYDPRSKRQLKLQCLAHLIKQSGKDLEEYWNRMRPLEQEVRKCYECRGCDECFDSSDYSSSNIKYASSAKFLEMIILHGCFILEFFQFQFFMSQQHKTIIKNHPIAQMERRKLPIIFQDLFQLGNQIPFLVLEGLFEICYPMFQREGDDTFVKERLLNIIGAVSLDALRVDRDYVRCFSSDPEHFEREFGFGGLKPLHLLDLIRLCFVSPYLVKRDAPKDLPQWNITLHGDNIPCISKLRLAGIKVTPQNQDHYLEVAFHAGAIKMPRIILNELMCSFLNNCVIFEHQYKGASKRISSYVLLLDSLVDNADDVDYLRQRRVLEHRKRTDAEGADFINDLGTHINFDGVDSNFFKLWSDANNYYKSKPRKKWVSFKKEYFDKPWLLASVFAGLVLLILTCLQTYYTMRPYLYPQN